MREMDILEFRRRLKLRLERPDVRFTFFVGAGCSVSSGIPSASSLVTQWLPRLKEIKTGNRDDVKWWTGEVFGEAAVANPGTVYGEVVEELFPLIDDRQAEMERICSNIDPALGYAVLAKLITHPKYGHQCNTVLTTNFDNLVADALYLYARVKPTVVNYDSLIGFTRTIRSVPYIVKLRGDAKFAPTNTLEATATLDKAVEGVVGILLRDSALVFIGYGGNDQNITNILKKLSPSSLQSGIYWVNSEVPNTELGEWLEQRNAMFVKHEDFDELMVHISEEFALDYPVKELFKDRFDELGNKTADILKNLGEKIVDKSDAEAQVLGGAVARTTKQFSQWWSVDEEARKYKETDTDKADEIYREGLKQFPNNFQLMDKYAIFLDEIRKDSKVDDYYERAIKADPNYAKALGNYALFLKNIREDYDAAEEYYERAILANPNYANALSNYANFLWKICGKFDAAEEHYIRAIKADPNHANVLNSYALFLKNIRKNYDAAEEYYKLAIIADPNYTAALNNYAFFLKNIRRDFAAANKYYMRAEDVDPTNGSRLNNYADYLKSANADYAAVEDYYKCIHELTK